MILASRAHLCMLLALVALSGGCSSRSQRQAGNGLNHLRRGEYLREDYIRALCETRSPLKATRPDADPQLFILDSDKDGPYLMPIGNFHEGDVPHRVSREGKLQKIESDSNRIIDTDFSFSAHSQSLSVSSKAVQHYHSASLVWLSDG
jgi:hypothetical protein